MMFLTNLGIREILCSFRLVTEGTGGKEVHESSKPEFLKILSANNLVSLDA